MTGGEAAASEGVGLRGARLGGLVALLCIGGFADLVLSLDTRSALAWSSLAVSVTVSVVAVVALCTGGRFLFTAAGAAAMVSLIATAVLATANRSGGALSTFGVTEGTALTFLVVACWRRAAGQACWVMTAAVVVAVPLLTLRLGFILDILLLVMAALLVTTVAVAVGGSLRSADVHRRSAVTAVRRAEREEVARELHDVVAHHVTGMVVLTQAARTVVHHPADLTAGGPSVGRPGAVAGAVPSFDKALMDIEQAGAEALASLRSMVAVLRSSDPDDAGGTPLQPTPTLADLDDVVRRFRDSGSAVHVDLLIASAAGGLPPQVQAAVHRVVQEALTNASRYARGAQRVWVDISCASGVTVLTVVDSGGRTEEALGVDNDAAWGGGFGIVGMRERVLALGGSLTAGPSAGPDGATSRCSGWTVRAEIPA